MKKLLYVDACLHRETSRTERLAQALINKLNAGGEYEVEVLVVEDARPAPMDTASLDKREACIAARDFDDPMFDLAKQFKDADEIVISAPYWDFSFPAMLKQYIEQLCVRELTFVYTEKGEAIGLCRGQRVHFVTTAGGYIGEFNYGFDQIKAVCEQYFGIGEACFYAAEGLDIAGNDVEAILAEAVERM